MGLRAGMSCFALVFMTITGCSDELGSSLASERSNGYVDIMPAAQAAVYKSLLPRLEDMEAQFILGDANTMWYDGSSIVPGYQDSMSDPEGFRPNTIQAVLIDTAVPGGWRRLFAARGKFNFPFASGGADLSDNMVKVNFWSAPRQNDQVLPVVYWRLNFSRWQWLFPVGTVIGEVLLVKFPDGELRVFEIRTRKRQQGGWVNKVFRPFSTATELAAAIKEARPNWQATASLRAVVQHLENQATLTPRTLETRSYPGTFTKVDGHLDLVPDFGDATLAKDLLRNTAFRSAAGSFWKTDGSKITHAAGTTSSASVVPKNYDGGMLPIDDTSCRRCHSDAGRQISHFHGDLIAYGEIWGEDETFSWHPFDNAQFVNANGDVVNFNNDNRRLRSDFVNAGLIERYDPARHPEAIYKALPRSWQYNPIIFAGEVAVRD